MRQFTIDAIKYLGAVAALFFACWFLFGCEDRIDYVVHPNCTDMEYDAAVDAVDEINDVLGVEAAYIVGFGVTEATGLLEIRCSDELQGYRLAHTSEYREITAYRPDMERVSRKTGEPYELVFFKSVLHELGHAIADCRHTDDLGHIMSGNYPRKITGYTEQDEERIIAAYESQ